MILEQFYLNCLAHASYVIGDEACGDAAVIDPQRDVDQYVRFALDNGLTIRHVVLTHLHADFIADASLVYPAHGAGSLCGKALSRETVSTIGEQRRVNYALQPMSKSTFIELVTADQPEAPAYFTYDAVLNSQRRPILYDTLTSELTPLALADVLTFQREGARVLDTRDPGEFVSAHLTGSLNIGLGGQFATWAGTVLTKDEATVLVANPGAETESALRLGRIGFDNVRGFLAGGLAAAEQRPELLASGTRLAPDVAAGRLAGAEPPLALDVRAAGEHAAMWIDGATHIPLPQLSNRLGELPAGRAITVFCAGGYRSSIAASLLRREGRDDVSEIAGGIAAWAAAGLPVARAGAGKTG